MSTIIDKRVLADDEEAVLYNILRHHRAAMKEDLENLPHGVSRFDVQIHFVTTEKLIDVIKCRDQHPGYWPAHPAITEHELADVMFFPITINGTTLPPTYVVFLRDFLRKVVWMPEYTRYIKNFGYDVQDYLTMFFGTPYLESL